MISISMMINMVRKAIQSAPMSGGALKQFHNQFGAVFEQNTSKNSRYAAYSRRFIEKFGYNPLYWYIPRDSNQSWQLFKVSYNNNNMIINHVDRAKESEWLYEEFD